MAAAGLAAILSMQGASVVLAQSSATQEPGVVAALLQEDRALERYVDTAAGLTVEEAVRYALEHN
ncbi:MAG TPA: hypothetical protein VFS10_13745, partial [Pyrinomonadaceae bacterium]|nr:hypothetical protein [Pyrinomonadaceae bacterium]